MKGSCCVLLFVQSSFSCTFGQRRNRLEPILESSSDSELTCFLQGQVLLQTPVLSQDLTVARVAIALSNKSATGDDDKIVSKEKLKHMPTWVCWVVVFTFILVVFFLLWAAVRIYLRLAPQHERDWEIRGDAFTLFISTARGLITQVAALTLIVLEVFSFHSTSSSYMMQCNPFKVGWVATYACEYAKAYVRSFPLVASMVSLLCASRIFMMQYLYYQILKRGALLSFGRFSALTDPLFKIMLWCCANCFINFVLKAATDAKLDLFDPTSVISSLVGEGTFLDSMQKMFFFFLPAVMYFSFLAAAYDVEETLVPLSKYMLDDEEDAKQVLANIPYLKEAHVAHALQDSEMLRTIPEVADDAYTKLIEAAQDKSLSKEGEDHVLSQWRLVNFWPAYFLLCNRWDDLSSCRFRQTWTLLSCINLGVMGAVFYYFVGGFVDKINDIRDGQLTDILGAVVFFAHMVLTMYLATLVLRGALLPFFTHQRSD